MIHLIPCRDKKSLRYYSHLEDNVAIFYGLFYRSTQLHNTSLVKVQIYGFYIHDPPYLVVHATFTDSTGKGRYWTMPFSIEAVADFEANAKIANDRLMEYLKIHLSPSDMASLAKENNIEETVFNKKEG